jgi:pimeloyl-ACP methyl ester carboxylesterase
MYESLMEISGEHIFLRHNAILPDRVTLLLVHGLGDSGLSFLEIFEDERFDSFNLLVPDLAGFGRSSGSTDYGLDAHVRRLSLIIEKLALQERTRIEEIIAVGHSLGGDLLTLFCASDRRGKVKKFVNIEGNLTQFDLFISCGASKADDRGEFRQWFNHAFIESTVYNEWGSQYESCRRYYASLRFAHPEAFLTSARELCAKNNSLDGQFKSEIGAAYCRLPIAKVFCCGARSVSPETIGFLETMGLEHKLFENAFHWPMIDNSREFYPFLHSFILNG